jgi:hypothetical protein
MNTIKTNWIFICLIAGLLLLLMLGKCKNNKLKKDNELKTIELSTLNDSVRTVVSKNGDLTFKLNSVVVEAASTRNALEAAGFEIKDLKARDVQWRKANFALKATIQAIGGGQTILHDTTIVTKTDTLKRADFAWNNRYLFFKGFVQDKNLKFEYTYNLKFDFLNTPVGKNKNIVSIMLDDPQAKVTSANSITIERKQHWWDHWYIYAGAGVVGGYYLSK